MAKKGRTKAKTLYGVGELEEYKHKNSGKFIQERKSSAAEE